MISEYSDSTDTPEKQEKLDFLNERNIIYSQKFELFRKQEIKNNELNVNKIAERTPKSDYIAKKIQRNLHELINKSKQTPLYKKVGKRTLMDPREGITRRYANYVPIKRYQYTEDSENLFYPNVDVKFRNQLLEEWQVNKGNPCKNTVDDDLILYEFLMKFGEKEEALEVYKSFRSVECDNKFILSRYKTFSEKVTEKKTVEFYMRGCSAKKEEGLNEFTIIKTHKELFCRRCEVYDCPVHGILDFSNHLQTDFPSNSQMIESYDRMVEYFEYTAFITALVGKIPCGDHCFLNPGIHHHNRELSEFVRARIKLGLQVFKFEPCNIRLYLGEDEITCREIFEFLREEYAETKTFGYNKNNKATPIKPQKKKSKPRKIRKQNFTANWKKIEENSKITFALNFMPCYHKRHDKIASEAEECCMSKECGCYERGYCDKFCGCDPKKCKIRRIGCDCRSNCVGKKCPCYALGQECDPDLCKCCFNTKTRSKTNTCTNQMIFFRNSKVCKIGPSEVCPGLGLFNIEPVYKGEYVLSYIGELISWEEADMREKYNVYDAETYLCTISDEHVIDAKYKGNKARFLNHGKTGANVFAKYFFSNGLYYFCFYAKTDIAPGSELLFDYEGGGSALKEQFQWIKRPNEPKIRKFKYEPDPIPITDSKFAKMKSGIKPIKINMTFKFRANTRKLLKQEIGKDEYSYCDSDEIEEEVDDLSCNKTELHSDFQPGVSSPEDQVEEMNMKRELEELTLRLDERANAFMKFEVKREHQEEQKFERQFINFRSPRKVRIDSDQEVKREQEQEGEHNIGRPPIGFRSPRKIRMDSITSDPEEIFFEVCQKEIPAQEIVQEEDENTREYIIIE